MEKINLVDFQKRKLKNFFVCVYVITKKVKIRTETSIAERDLNLLYGIDIFGYRQVLGIYFDNTHNNRFWLEKFEDLKARNVEKILYFVSPDNKNLERCIKIIYNDVKIVYSPDNIYQKITQFFAEHPSRKMQISLKNLFLAETEEEYKRDIKFFKDFYVDNKLIMILLEKNEPLISEFYQYNHDLRTLFYPYYTIRETQKKLNKLNTLDNLCTNINEIIEFCLPIINSFEVGRNTSRQEWLKFVSNLYEQFPNELEEYING